MVLLVIFIVVLAICVIAVLVGLISLISLGIKNRRQQEYDRPKKRAIRSGITAAATLVLCIALVGISQATASTPNLTVNSDDSHTDSISELIELDLNGTKQWVSIRGEDTSKPILLFLAGGPGGSQMAAVRHELSDLEQDFIVVNWDQPGSGKSYAARSIDQLTPEVYVKDGIALVEYLCDRFGRESILLVGESWGSALGIFMASERPELFDAFIGTGQMVDFVETEIIDYELALQLASEEGNEDLVATLESNGKPPYYGADVTWKSAAYLNYLSTQMTHNPEITNSGYNTFRDLASEEYGIVDKVNYIRGIIDTFNHVYPQLYDIDLREHYSQLEVPVYFLLGRHDINAPTELVEDYYAVLDAPYKEIIWFEHSGHSPWINESDKFIETIRDIAKTH